MIAVLKGKLFETGLAEVVIDVNGVGYGVMIPMSTYDKLPKVGEEATLFIHTHVREDAITLFGFATKEEKSLFNMLLSVSGIGPKLALSVLSSMSIPSFCMATASGDVKVLSKISGIGKKTAERLVVELKDKVSKLPGASPFARAVPDEKAQAAEDALLALEQLGFVRLKAQKAIHEIVSLMKPEECTSEGIIRKALQELNK